ncbi:MAG TPA: zinc ribbon domain-containing protein [Methanoregula sp.]|nr:zinc ribbon domain-containing protein [Methanoregula sp.]
MVTFCPKCGTQAVDGQSQFCNMCGSELPADISEETGKYCPNCTAKITDREAVSCARCGFQLLPKKPLTPSVRPTRQCPQCGNPVVDENRFYCNSCGAYIKNTKAGNVSLSDGPAGSKTGIKKPVIIPGIHQNMETKTVTEPGSVVAKRNFDGKNPIIKKIGIVMVVIVGIALLTWVGSMLLGSVSLLPSDNEVLVTQDLDSITLQLSDLPSGWMSGDAVGTDDAYSAQFFTSSENSEALVEETITRFPGIEEARLELNSERQQVTGLTVETINLGNGGFSYIDVNYVMVIFRRGNIIVKIEDTRTEYQENPTMNNAKNYAEIVAGRIK